MKKSVLSLGIGLVSLTFATVPHTYGQAAIQHTNSITAANPSENQLGQVTPARQFIGQELKSSNGEKLGKVEDFVVDLESGRVLYGLVNEAGASRAIPATMFIPGSDRKTLTTQVTKQQLNSAPAVPKGDTAQLGSTTFASGIYRHFNQNPWWQSDASATQSGQDFGNVHRVTQLMNMPVQSSANEKVGKIQNALLDLKSGRVAFLILNPSDILGQGKNLVAVPPNAFTKGTDNTLVTGLDKDMLSGAPKYNNNLAELSRPDKAAAIYSYYGKQPWFNPGLSPTGR